MKTMLLALLSLFLFVPPPAQAEVNYLPTPGCISFHESVAMPQTMNGIRELVQFTDSPAKFVERESGMRMRYQLTPCTPFGWSTADPEAFYVVIRPVCRRMDGASIMSRRVICQWQVDHWEVFNSTNPF